MRAMRRYRESFVARKRAPTRQVFRPDAFDCRAFPRTHARRGNNHPDCSDLRFCRSALARDGALPGEASFDSGAGADFANGTSTLADLAKYAA
ncbi:hypothetical protein QYZ09_01895, partial [Xanthomonas campestris pv. campestris]|nr:hypothetical protein [Xanthomonas campestris pv. campestris]